MSKATVLALGVLGLAVSASAGTLGVFTENTDHATGSSFGAGAAIAPYGWLSPVGDSGKTWEIYRKKVTGNGVLSSPDMTLVNSGNQANITNEFFGSTGTTALTDLGMVFGVAGGTASPALALQTYSNQGMEFRVGFMQTSKIASGWLSTHYGDNRTGNMDSANWGQCQDFANSNNGADSIFLKIKFDGTGALVGTPSGIYTHSGIDTAGGETNFLIANAVVGTGTVGSGLQPVSWSLSDAGAGLANFQFQWGGFSYSYPGLSLTKDSRDAAFAGAAGTMSLTDITPVIFVGGGGWGTAGVDGAVAVPEPATLGMLGLAAVGLLRRRHA